MGAKDLSSDPAGLDLILQGQILLVAATIILSYNYISELYGLKAIDS